MPRWARGSVLLLGLALVASLLGGIAETAAQTTTEAGVTARIGGTRQEFEAKYGAPIADVASFVYPVAASYKVKGYGYVVAYFDSDQLLFVQLTPARADGKPGFAPDPADWSVNKATELAQRFLPTDAKLDPAKDLNGDKLVSCTSQALAAAVPQQTYTNYRLNGKPGDCQTLIHLDTNGNVFLIDIGLGNGGAPTNSPISVPLKPTATAAPTSTATAGNGGQTLPIPQQGTAAPVNPGQTTATSSADKAYFASVLSQMVQLKASLDNFTTLLNNAQPNDQTWTSKLQDVFSTWKKLDQEAQKLTPPADQQAFHQKYLQMLQLYNQVASDITQYLSNGDQSLLNDGDAKLKQAADLFDQLRNQLLQTIPGGSQTPGAAPVA